MSIKRLRLVLAPVAVIGFFIGWILILIGSYQHKPVKKIYVEDNIERNIRIVCVEPTWIKLENDPDTLQAMDESNKEWVKLWTKEASK